MNATMMLDSRKAGIKLKASLESSIGSAALEKKRLASRKERDDLSVF